MPSKNFLWPRMHDLIGYTPVDIEERELSYCVCTSKGRHQLVPQSNDPSSVDSLSKTGWPSICMCISGNTK